MGRTVSSTSYSEDSWQKSHSDTKEEQRTEQQSEEHSKQQSQQQTTSKQESATQQQSQSESYQATNKTLNTELANLILSGLYGFQTDEELAEYARNLLMPQLNAGLEAAQQKYDTQALSTQQQKDELAYELQRAIEEQQKGYQQSMADVQNAALARGMGRSSYLLQSLAGQGDNLSEVIRQLTEQTDRQTTQLEQQLALAAQQNAETQGRLNTDYASQLAAKIQELRESQRKEYNSNYLTAISSALGSETTGRSASTGTSATQTTGLQNTVGSSTTDTTGKASSQMVGTATTDTTGQSHTSGNSTTVTVSGGGGGGSKKSSPTSNVPPGSRAH